MQVDCTYYAMICHETQCYIQLCCNHIKRLKEKDDEKMFASIKLQCISSKEALFHSFLCDDIANIL